MTLEETAAGAGTGAVMGAGTRHVPVLLSACLEVLAPAPGRLFVDGTLGGGGHCGALLAAGAGVIALDWDAAAHARTDALQATYGARLLRVQAGFGEWATVLPRALIEKDATQVSGVLLDLGFSSDQLDDPARGLSYHVDGPLDMRLDSRRHHTAADLLNEESEAVLAQIFYRYGEEPKSRHLAHLVVSRRKSTPWTRTAQLRALIEELYPLRFGLLRAHPAARIFQALRIAVNGELDQLAAVLPVAAQALAPSGKLAVITFQPAEDRLVKAFYKKVCQPVLDTLGRQVAAAPYRALKKIEPATLEVVGNPRARSAKLRVLARAAATPA